MKSIAGYNVIKLLAKGGMSAIYLAEQQSLQRQVVLKLLNPKLEDAVKKRFIDEGLIIASLKHPNIITVFDVVSVGKHNFIAMEYLPDGDLEARLESKLDTFTVLNILSQISDALHLIHKQGIIHGDIKPANVLFRGKNCPLLTDFGISHRIEPKKEVDLGSNDLYASPTYASPELIQGKPFDYRTDLYSLGIMMYEMLLGTKPYTGETEIEMIANSIQEPIPKLPEDIQGLQPLLDSLLAKKTDDRLSDAKLVTRFISQYLEDHSDITKPSETKLIDTDVVVEYVAKNKEIKPNKVKHNHLSLLILTLILLLTVLLNKETLWDKYFVSDAPKTISSNNTSSLTSKKLPPASKLLDELKVPEEAKDSVKSEPNFEQNKNINQEYIEQQKILEQQNAELELIKKELASQKNLARNKSINKNRTISRYLKKGRASLKKYQLTTPLNDNALYYFQQVLEINRNNSDAQKGVEDVVYRYELLARGALDKYQYQKAQSFISSGLSIDKDNERLLALQKEANLHNEPKRVINKVKGFFNNL